MPNFDVTLRLANGDFETQVINADSRQAAKNGALMKTRLTLTGQQVRTFVDGTEVLFSGRRR